MDHCGRCSHRRCLVCGRKLRWQRFCAQLDQSYQWVGLEPSQSETTAPLPEGETEVVFLDVGQGDAVLILQNGAACLIDAGPKDARQNLVQDLRSYGVSSWTCW